MKFFSFKKKQSEKKDNIDSLLLSKLDQIIELLEKQQKDTRTETEGRLIHLEHVQIDHLENIIFRLDNIEIDELSGKLLIGTNISSSEDFAASLVQKIDKERAKNETPSDAAPDEPNMTKTAKGFRFRNTFS